MQIEKLKIQGFKAFTDFEINFDTPETGDSLSVLIGNNGAGKSSILEAILRILGAFYSPKIADEMRFDFELVYTHAAKKVTLMRQREIYSAEVFEGNELVFTNRGLVKELRTSLDSVGLRIFPLRIITFYSGINDKLLPITKALEISYKKAWRKDVINYLDLTYSESLVERKVETTFTRYDKRFIHCDDNLVPIYLLALLYGSDSTEKAFLQSELRLDGDLEITIELNLLGWKNGFFPDGFSNDWEAWEYTALAKNFYSVMSFIFDNNSAKEAFMWHLKYAEKTIVGNKMFFSLNSKDIFDIPQSQIYNFFERLTALFNAKISVSIVNELNRIDIMNFSEGQRQLIKLYGMLGICKNEESLVLMDEPDAHMNPKWKYNIKEYIHKAVEGAINTQIIVATHDPLVINGMQKENIKIIVAEGNSKIKSTDPLEIKVYEADEDAIGMGIDGLLQSEYYGLNSTLDPVTQGIMEERRKLVIKNKEKTITKSEHHKLVKLNEQISKMGFASISPSDNLFDDYLVALSKVEDIYKKEFSPEEIKEREEKSLQIMQELLRRDSK